MSKLKKKLKCLLEGHDSVGKGVYFRAEFQGPEGTLILYRCHHCGAQEWTTGNKRGDKELKTLYFSKQHSD